MSASFATKEVPNWTYKFTVPPSALPGYREPSALSILDDLAASREMMNKIPRQETVAIPEIRAPSGDGLDRAVKPERICMDPSRSLPTGFRSACGGEYRSPSASMLIDDYMSSTSMAMPKRPKRTYTKRKPKV